MDIAIAVEENLSPCRDLFPILNLSPSRSILRQTRSQSARAIPDVIGITADATAWNREAASTTAIMEEMKEIWQLPPELAYNFFCDLLRGRNWTVLRHWQNAD